jgi:phytoene dehydrogenase-like protein
VLVDDRAIDLHRDRAPGAPPWPRLPAPGRRRGRFWDEVERLATAMRRAARRFPVLPLRHPADLIDSARAAHPSLLPVVANLGRSVGDRMDAYGIDDPHLRAFVDGQLLDAMQCRADACVAPNGALALDVYRSGAQYVLGGLSSWPRPPRRRPARGGSVRFGTAARAILRDDRGRVAGVTTRHGLMRAPVVVSAVPLRNTVALLGEDATERLRRRDAEPAAHVGRVHALRRRRERPRCARRRGRSSRSPTSRPRAPPPRRRRAARQPARVGQPGRADRSRAPAGHHAVTVSTHVDAGRWTTLARDKARTSAAKRALEARLLDQVERVLPGFRDGVGYLRSGTPRTFVRYTRRADGTVGGFPQTVRHANFGAPSHRTDVPGLFLAGDTVFPGQGALGATSSGFIAARSAERRLRSSIVLARGQPPVRGDPGGRSMTVSYRNDRTSSTPPSFVSLATTPRPPRRPP